MEIKLLKYTAINCFALMLMVVMVSVVISKSNDLMIFANGAEKQNIGLETENNEDNNEIINKLSQIHNAAENSDNTKLSDLSISEKLGTKYLIIKKTGMTLQNINLEDLYMEKSIHVSITGLTEEEFNDSSLVRMNQGTEYTGIINSDQDKNKDSIDEVPDKAIISDDLADPVKGFEIQYSYNDNTRLYAAEMNIKLDHIYAYNLYQDDDNIYIDLRRPKEVYDKIIVIDPGHGGKDCGTFSKDEQFYEKDINLSLVLDLKEILDQKNIKVYYTRTTDQTVFLNPRVNLANEVEADFFISLHCNANESPKPGGSEVLYNERIHTDGFGSKQLAQICLDAVKNITHKVNRGLADGSDVIIVRKAKMPVALVEVAFMSNEEDMKFLVYNENRKKVAQALSNAIEKAYGEIEK
jgi:N-acetylmuramoyl-L-alanine amidase